uniref:Glycosyltransferase n=1 Tax=viral metagenome TaxID=1070528 RepID=A0A6C0D7L6_9ZZZZ
MDNWVAPYLSDGLGNRLFQYACAKQYSKNYNKPLVFFLPRCNPTNHGKFDTIFRLFPEVPVLETDVSWNEIEEPMNKHFKFYNLENMNRSPTVIRGYRQSYKYFDSIKIQPNFENIVSKERLETLENKYIKDNSFFIHVRLGDFRILPHHQINLPKYLIMAASKIPSDSNIIVFSDEPELVKGLFNFPHIVCDEKDEVEVLYLMSKCTKGAIVANSTFSFWGAYLAHNNSENFRCVFPSTMGKEMPALEDYIPSWATVCDATF